MAACEALENEWGPHNSAPLLYSIAELTTLMRTHAGLSEHGILRIVEDLKYDHTVKWTEPMYQPLFEVGSGLLAFLPLVVCRSNFERNLLVLLEKLPLRKKDAYLLKTGREDLMVESILPILSACGLLQAKRVSVAGEGVDYGDVDLLIWEQSGGRALCVSLKWFYGPDAIQEVKNHDDRFVEGLEQLRGALTFIMKSPTRFWADRALKPPLGERAAIEGVLVSKEGLPSGLVHDETLPIVRLVDFLDALRKCHGDLGMLSTRLQALAIIAPDVRQMVFGHQEFPLGGYRMQVPIVQYH